MDTIDSEFGTPDVRMRRYILRYTAAFGVVALFAFSVYIIKGKTLIWDADAWSQHFKALVYYANYLRGIVRTLFSEGRLVIPEWDFAIGEGGDVLTTLHYYVIGDPLTVFSVFVPTRYLYFFYDALSILRMYIAGAVFSYYCFFMGAKNTRAVTVGALTYVFSHWAVTNAARHPFFLNPLIYFPLLLIGFELIMKRRRPYLLILTVAVAALSNFYFFYMLAIVSAFYIVCRLVYEVRRGSMEKRYAAGTLLRISGCSALGVLIAAVILLPIIAAFLRDSRVEVDYEVGLLYPLYYYCQLPGLIAGDGGGGYWLCAGFSAAVFPSVVLMLRRRGYGLCKFFLAACAAAVCFPVIGYALNGFAYVTNRWCWALAFLVSFIVVLMWDRLTELELSDYVCLCICECVLFVLVLLFNDSRTLTSQAEMALSLIMLITLVPKKSADGNAFFSKKQRERIVAGFACVSMIVGSLCFNSSAGGDYVSEHIDIRGINGRLKNNETAVIRALSGDDDGFFRYSGSNIITNAGLIAGLSSTQYYWSLSNPNVIEHNTELEIRDYWISGYSGWDGRTIMNTLSSVRYYVTSADSRDPIPYGYTQLDRELTGENYNVYENDYALPLAYTYDKIISESVWSGLDAAEREAAMLIGVYISDGVEGFDEVPEDELHPIVKSRYTVLCRDGVTHETGRFTVTKEGVTASLIVDYVSDSEAYIEFKNLGFDLTTEYELYLGSDELDPKDLFTREDWEALPLSDRWAKWQDHIFWDEPMGVSLLIRSGSVSNSIVTYRRAYQFYNGRSDYIANLGCKRIGPRAITIVFPKAGVYTYDELNVMCRPMGNYGASIAKLKASTLDELTVGANTVSGTISRQEPGLLTFSIPYSDGWRAFIDGEPAELYRANTAYMAVVVDSGEHTVELRYSTPYLKTGAAVSAVSIAFLAVFAAVYETRKRKNKAK